MLGIELLHNLQNKVKGCLDDVTIEGNHGQVLLSGHVSFSRGMRGKKKCWGRIDANAMPTYLVVGIARGEVHWATWTNTFMKERYRTR